MAGANEVIGRCRLLAEYTEEPGFTTRTFLSAPMHQVHQHVRAWMEEAGMTVRVDHAGNIRGSYPASKPGARCFYIGSHLDTVPHAGAFDGVLGVILAIALVERLGGRRLSFGIEAIGFSEEEGVRFGTPFIGSRALIGDIDANLLERISGTVREFGLDPARIDEARASGNAHGYLEIHIEQGPVLDRLDLGVGVVNAIAGQSRFEVTFQGETNHAATPMSFRHDALTGAAEWIGAVERFAQATPGMVATVGRLHAEPGATNVIAGLARASLDVRYCDDAVRRGAADHLSQCAREICARRGLNVQIENLLDRSTVRMDDALTNVLREAVARSGHPVHTMTSGAGHDAMIMASRMPVCMLFLRSPGGISHDPGEAVRPEDVEAGLEIGLRFLEGLDG